MCIGVNITLAVGFVVTFAEIRALKLHLWRLNHHTNPAIVTLLKSCWPPTSKFSRQSTNCHRQIINELPSTLLTNTMNLFWSWLLGNIIKIINHITGPIQIFEMPSNSKVPIQIGREFNNRYIMAEICLLQFVSCYRESHYNWLDIIFHIWFQL